MRQKVAEQFENPPSQSVMVSPALKGMMTSGQVPVTTGTQTAFEREQDLQRSLGQLIGPTGVRHMLGPDGEEHWIPNFGPDGPENWPYGPEPKPKPGPEPKPKPGPEPKPKPQPAPKPHPEPAPVPAGCPACPVCPDMSQYIRLDEVPCWNCTLP